MSSRKMTEAVLKAGLITPSVLAEMKRFGAPIDPDAKLEEPKDLETAASIMAQALESEGYVMVRETDLEVLHQYASTSRRGRLHLETDEGASTDLEVTFGVTRFGDYIIAWRSESIEELLTDTRCFLDVDGTRVRFKGVRELFYGDVKAFMVCSVASTQPIEGLPASP